MTGRLPLGEPAEVSPLARVTSIVALLFIFLLGVKTLGEGFELIGRDLLNSFFTATENPFIGLIVGLLATTVMQSSSVTTSMVVALVAAPETPLPLANAIPMIMGANIGTAVTSTIVSLGHVGRPEEFKRAFPVALCHDLFNYLVVLVLLPLELITGYLQRSAMILGALIGNLGPGGITYQSPLRAALDVAFVPLETVSSVLFSAQVGQAVFLVVTSAAIIFTALFLLVKVMRAAALNRVERIVTNVLGSRAILGMAIGVIVTVMVQSSSITTSLLVPLAASGVLRLEQAFPVTMGANVGTTVTAFMAALAVSGPNAAAGLEIALVHLLFNLSGIVIIYPVRAIRQVPLNLAQWLTRAALRSRKMTIFWLAAAFYGIPSVVLLLSRWLG